jgi:23S rRNA (cytosine1962-C5)-methyltransferase
MQRHERELLEAASTKRRALFAGRRIDAYRVLNGPGDGAPAGLTVDRYLDWIIVSARASLREDVIERWTQAILLVLEPKGIVLERLAKERTSSTVTILAGSVPDTPVHIREEDAVFSCDLGRGHTGLFLDLREVRLDVGRRARDQEVLNLFAHTCAFSIHAALGGASRVTSVDVSKKALTRGRENMIASGLDPDRHRWFTDDALDHLRRRNRYGLVIVDPPVFGRSKRGRTFSLLEDLDRLLDGAFARASEGGIVVVCTHATQLGGGVLRGAMSARGTVISEAGLPPDFPVRTEPSEDRGDYLKVVMARR